MKKKGYKNDINTFYFTQGKWKFIFGLLFLIIVSITTSFIEIDRSWARFKYFEQIAQYQIFEILKEN